MPESKWYTDPEGFFEIQLPEGWSAEPDEEEGGIELQHPEGSGILHLLGFPHPEDEPADPGEELYAFLEEQEIELQEDEVEDLALSGAAEMAMCEFISEGDEEEAEEAQALYWLMAVATAPGALLFATYSCPAGEEDAERESVRSALRSLRLHAPV